VRVHRDTDVVLVEAMLAPPALDDARRSLAYWERRRKALPLYQRRARQEAREMAARWEARVREAERVRFESSVLGRALTALGLSRLIGHRVRLTKWGLLSLAWAFLPRKIKLVAGGLVAAWVIVVLGVLTLVAVGLTQLA
jgi:hypothetical protein